MNEVLLKLSPHRDLQVYFERPSAIAVLSGASVHGFVVSGTWRQQFDWAVVEWNRDNVFEPHFMRSLPDGDLSGLTLSYEEVRENCIALDSDLYPTVDWHVLRIWTHSQDGVDFYKVNLRELASPVEGAYVCASLSLTLGGQATPYDYVGISLLDQHYTYEVQPGDAIGDIIGALTSIVNTLSAYADATFAGDTITLYYRGSGVTYENSIVGANGNRIGAYGYVSGSKSEEWSPGSGVFSAGGSPTKWRVTIPFDSLIATDGRAVPVQNVRKIRWTYAADLQRGGFERSEFSARISDWNVTGTNREYGITGNRSKRYEDAMLDWQYAGNWASSIGNFSGGTIHHCSEVGSTATFAYESHHDHELALGTRLSYNAAQVQVWLDGALLVTRDLQLAGEDQLCRVLLGMVGPGQHVVEIRHAGPDGLSLYLDFLETFIRQSEVSEFPADTSINLATDWDTDHSLAIPPERTAWLIHTLGFHGRVNHYVGALWYYELIRTGHQYASTTVEFIGTPVFSEQTVVTIGRDGYSSDTDLVAIHLNRIGDTAESIARAFELEFNRGYTAIRATSTGNVLTLYSRTMGEDGHALHVAVSPTAGPFQVVLAGDHLAGGENGTWHTDVLALPRLNRGCRDWSAAFFQCMKDYGLDVTCAFSMELQHGDTDAAAGIAQRYPNGDAVYLNTPALQTNFSPTSLAFWQDVYLGMAEVMASSGLVPYLQFGEVQWWYFPLEGVGMTFYDSYTTSRFAAEYNRPLPTISSHLGDPTGYVDELLFLSGLIGEFTSAVMSYVRVHQPTCRFEVLYPTDVNESPLNALVNFPEAHWTSSILDCLKTESFTYTFLRNVDLGRITVEYGRFRGFEASQRAFLCGIGDSSTSWRREVALAKGENIESITLFALDQFCLIGYETPLRLTSGRAVQF
ncbi:MAG: hypothetical protein ABI972_00985 [Acidobacteriota bacterium]